MNRKIIVDGDLEVSFKKIKQSPTYEGFLEGLPTRSSNQRLIPRVYEEAKKYCGLEEVFLIEPDQTPIPVTPSYKGEAPMEFPPITILAELYHFGVFKDRHKDYSSLGLVWFQHDFAFPIDEDILAKIVNIPFRKCCGEFYIL